MIYRIENILLIELNDLFVWIDQTFELDHPAGQPLALVSLAALGVVYGDIGTSPLYVMKTVFDPVHGLTASEGNVVGIISLIFWALMMVVSLKYITLILRADNHGEGGIMALLSLASSSVISRPHLRNILFLIGAFGAALFYGDGVITPAISVLSAVEGLEVATPLLKPYVAAHHVGCPDCTFPAAATWNRGNRRDIRPRHADMVQYPGFVGVMNIIAAPQILTALNPLHAFAFCVNNGWLAFIAFGAVVLGGYGRRSTLCGHGALWRKTDPLGMVCLRAARAHVELPRARGFASLQSVSNFQSFLSPVSCLGAISRCRVGDSCYGHCFAISHIRCFFDDQAGNPTGIFAAHADQIYIRPEDRPDLYALCQLDPAGGGSHGSAGIWLILELWRLRTGLP